MTTIIAKLEAHPAGATEAQVEQLALAMYTAGNESRRGDATYFRIVLSACQAKLGKRGPGRRPSLDTAAQLTVLEATNDRFYAAVLRGVTTPDVAAEEGLETAERQRRMLERNRRSGFARSAVATLRAYATAGGDLRTLDAATASKSAVRAALAPPEPTDKVSRQIARAEGSLVRSLRRQARASPEEARATVERLLVELQSLADGFEDEGAADAGATTVVPAGLRSGGHTRTRVGVPMLHRPSVGAP